MSVGRREIGIHIIMQSKLGTTGSGEVVGFHTAFWHFALVGLSCHVYGTSFRRTYFLYEDSITRPVYLC